MSSLKPARTKGVQISKETGGAYADVREVIESELTRIRGEWAKKTNSSGMIRNTDDRHSQNHDGNSTKKH